MGRAELRKLKHAKHTLIKASFMKTTIMFKLGSDQTKYTCSCGSGWLSISNTLPVEAHKAHVAQMKGD